MVKHRIRRIYYKFSELSHLHAVINIIESHRELFRKSAHSVKDGALAHHAGRCDRAVILSTHRAVEIAVLGFMKSDKRMTGDTAETDDNTGMLDRVILVEQSRSDDTHVLSLGKAKHLFNEIFRDQLNIVVHKQKVLALCVLYAEIVDRRVVELPLPADNMYIRELLLDLLVVIPGRLFRTVVLHDDELQILIGSLRQHRADAVVEVHSVVLVRDNYGHKRIILDLKRRVIDAVIHALFYLFCLNSHSLVVVHDGTGTGCEGIKLALRVACRGIRVAAPVIEHLRDMADLLCVLRTAENKVVILRSVILCPEAANFIEQSFFHHKQMADIVDARQKVRIKIRLEMRVKQLISIHVKLVLVGIEDVAVFILIQFFRALKESVRCQAVIMICKYNEITFRHLKGSVRISGDTAVFPQYLIADPCVFLRIFL